jgi:nucleotide-binding universal stress UspA family protein
MGLNDILVCLDGTDAGAQRLKLAAAIAAQHHAHLVAVYILREEANGTAFRLADEVTDGADRAGASEERFRECLRLNGLEGSWHLFDGADTAGLVALAKSVDLVVVGQYSRELGGKAAFRPDDIALACGRPLLIVPYAGEFTTIGGRVLVAWDDTREATRALHDALPLLGAAESVTVLTVLAQEKQFDGARAATDRVVRHLAHHGVPARAEESLRGDLAVSDVLLSRAADLGADLMVAGAYHHSQWREALIGGVSRELMQHMTLPLLVSH